MVLIPLFFLFQCQSESEGDDSLTSLLLLNSMIGATSTGTSTSTDTTTSTSTSTTVAVTNSDYSVSYYSGGTTASVNLNLGNTKDLYFVFTNTNSYSVSGSSLSISGSSSSSSSRMASDMSGTSNGGTEERSDPENRIIRGTPEANEFNSLPATLETSGYLGKIFEGETPTPSYTTYTTGDTYTFYDGLYTGSSNSVPATLRYSTTDGSTTLYIWVADNSWTGAGCTRAACVTQTMVDALGPKFLLTGSDNDIYDWVTNVVGSEWGTTGYSSLVTNDDTIHILLYDIDTDNSQTGGVVGFFYAKDNFLKTSYSGSNERIMFYLDSVMFATESTSDSDSIWTIDDYWPAEMVATLAHEFQHMVQYYQKTILTGVTEPSWVNEMASMMIEGLLSRKMGVIGPRGVDSETKTAGSSGNAHGYNPYFIDDPYDRLVYWDSKMYDYAGKYSFGSFLMRNCGGASFINKLVVGNSSTGTAGVKKAMNYSSSCSDWTFNSAMKKWGAAVLLSDRVITDKPYIYNTGDWNSSTMNGITYDVGSENYYNYSGSYSSSGPYLMTSLSSWTLEPTSNNYYLVSKSVTGVLNYSVTLPSGVDLTVVTK